MYRGRVISLLYDAVRVSGFARVVDARSRWFCVLCGRVVCKLFYYISRVANSKQSVHWLCGDEGYTASGVYSYTHRTVPIQSYSTVHSYQCQMSFRRLRFLGPRALYLHM